MKAVFKDSRVWLTFSAILLFCSMFSFWIYNLQAPLIPVINCKICLCYTLLGALLCYRLNDYFYTTEINNRFNKIILYSVMFDLLIILLNYQGIVTNTASLILTFNGLIFAVTLLIVINMQIHGYFKTEYEND